MKKTGQVKPRKWVCVLPLSLLISDAGDFHPCGARLQGKRLAWSAASCFDGPFISMAGI